MSEGTRDQFYKTYRNRAELISDVKRYKGLYDIKVGKNPSRGKYPYRIEYTSKKVYENYDGEGGLEKELKK